MTDDFEKYSNKLLRDRTALPESVRFYRLDDVVTASKQDEWLPLFAELFSQLNVTVLLFAKTSLPFADFLVERADPQSNKLVPKDSETKVFLHDIPFIREREWVGKSKTELATMIVHRLNDRKAVIIQNLGVIATGGVTVEQAFIGFSTICHTTFVKYLLDLLVEGFKLRGEERHFSDFKKSWLKLPDLSDLRFLPGPFEDNAECGERPALAQALVRAGRRRNAECGIKYDCNPK